MKSDSAEGFINLDPIYGKHKNIFPVNFNSSNDLKFLCPECETNLLIDSRVCPQCGSGLISFTTPPQGTFECCTNQGCNWQSWDLVGKESRLDYLEIKISDTGCGIAKEEIDKIFEPFFSTKGQKGTGLGLAVIWGIIDNHDGIISVESEFGKGTTFSIKLPIQKYSEKEKDILAIDDEQVVVNAIVKILGNENFSVDTSTNSSEALAKINSNKYNLIICDIMMPDADGFEILNQVQKVLLPHLLLCHRVIQL